MKKCFSALALAVILSAILAVPSMALSVDIGGESGGVSTFNSVTYSLDPDSTATSHTVMAEGQTLTTIQASGSGAISAVSDEVGAAMAGKNIQTNMEMGGSQIVGSATVSGVEFGIDANKDIAFSGEALGLAPDGTVQTLGALITGPVITANGGNANAYVFTGRKWTQKDPQIKMQLTADANFAKTGLTTAGALGAITAATNTWDAATNQNLFSDSGASLTNARNWKIDGINDIAFKPYTAGCTALASSGTWYKIQGVTSGQYYPIIESDISFNSNYKWSTSGTDGYDFQSVALHELGHTIGLGDLYGRAAYTKDTRQVMHYYTGVKRTLGNGDETGVWKLYG